MCVIIYVIVFMMNDVVNSVMVMLNVDLYLLRLVLRLMEIWEIRVGKGIW